MKRILTSFVILMLAVALCAAPAFAQKGCSKKCSKTCSAPCPTKKTDKSAESDAKVIKECASVVLAIEGMTCGGSEGQVSKAIKELKGVLAIESISHKDGKAVVCVVPETDAKMIASTVTKLGYKTEIKETGKTHACTHGDKSKCTIKTEEVKCTDKKEEAKSN